MFNFGTALVLATAASAIPSYKIVKRDVTTVLTNLETIDTDTNTLTTAITSWDGSLLGALGISGDTTTLENDINSANTEAKTEAQADDADTQKILDYINTKLGPDIDASLDALVAREADFAALGLTGTVYDIIVTLKNDTDALSATLITISATDLQDDATAAAVEIDTSFDTALAAYSS